jgi:hypothetical protein
MGRSIGGSTLRTERAKSAYRNVATYVYRKKGASAMPLPSTECGPTLFVASRKATSMLANAHL